MTDVAVRAARRLRYDMPPPRADGRPVTYAVSETIQFLPRPDCRQKVP